MFLLRKPTDAQIRDYLSRQSDQPFSYDSVGCTRGDPRTRVGWNIDRSIVHLGEGEQLFRKACDALYSWRMFPASVATICLPQPPREGLNVAVLYWAAPIRLWLLLAARVVYLIHETMHSDGAEIERFGFGYGTLPDHAERGEERFLVEWNRDDDGVYYKLLVVSQPRHWLARLGYPYTRYEQARFRHLSGAAMQRAVTSPP